RGKVRAEEVGRIDLRVAALEPGQAGQILLFEDVVLDLLLVPDRPAVELAERSGERRQLVAGEIDLLAPLADGRLGEADEGGRLREAGQLEARFLVLFVCHAGGYRGDSPNRDRAARRPSRRPEQVEQRVWQRSSAKGVTSTPSMWSARR